MPNHCLSQCYQAITWTSVDLSLVKSSDIHLMATSLEIPQPSITTCSLKSTCLKSQANLPGANELRVFTVDSNFLHNYLIKVTKWWVKACRYSRWISVAWLRKCDLYDDYEIYKNIKIEWFYQFVDHRHCDGCYNGLVQGCGISFANTLEIVHSYMTRCEYCHHSHELEQYLRR